jgi:hypothetical protein
LVNLRVSDRLTAKYVERSLLVSDIATKVRPRAVALAITELLRASWLELVLTQDRFEEGAPENEVRNRLVTHLKERTVEDGEPRPSSPEQAEADAERKEQEDAARDERWDKRRLEWVAGARIFPQGDSGDLTTTVSLSLSLNRRLRLSIGGMAAGGGINRPGGNIGSFEGAGRVGVGFSGGTLLEIEVAPCVEVGYVKLSATSVGDQRGPVAIGSLQSTIRTMATKGVDVLMGVQAGYVFSPVEVKAEGQTVGGLKGPMLGVLAGLAGIL